MQATLDGKLVVAISSRALFDFEEENRVFDQSNDRAYMALQLGRIDEPALPGVAFPLIKKLLAFNTADVQRVEVAILSRNDPLSGLRVLGRCVRDEILFGRARLGIRAQRLMRPARRQGEQAGVAGFRAVLARLGEARLAPDDAESVFSPGQIAGA